LQRCHELQSYSISSNQDCQQALAQHGLGGFTIASLQLEAMSTEEFRGHLRWDTVMMDAQGSGMPYDVGNGAGKLMLL
jgi:hypothetical protein